MCYIANTTTIIPKAKKCVGFGTQQHLIRIPSVKLLEMDYDTHKTIKNKINT